MSNITRENVAIFFLKFFLKFFFRIEVCFHERGIGTPYLPWALGKWANLSPCHDNAMASMSLAKIWPHLTAASISELFVTPSGKKIREVSFLLNGELTSAYCSRKAAAVLKSEDPEVLAKCTFVKRVHSTADDFGHKPGDISYSILAVGEGKSS